MSRVVLATHNAHKVDELKAILALVPELSGLQIVGAGQIGAPSPVEDGVTFADNALLKARATVAATGLPALADDSGLCVDVLGGAPGVFSARWAGSHGDDAANLALLLDQIADVPDAHRGAEFRCAAALVTPDGVERVETGVLRGRLTRAPRGTGGFGYDPILEPEVQPDRANGVVLTSAELSPAEKNAISHRGHAFRAMVPHLVALLGSAAR